MTSTETKPTLALKRGHKVLVSRYDFAKREWVWDETAAVLAGGPTSVSETSGFWWPVRFADGGRLRVHETSLRPI